VTAPTPVVGTERTVAAPSALDLSVIIVNWNVCELLRECLLSVRRSLRLARERYEVIVVDNASADGSVDMLRAEFPDVRLIASDANLGFGRGCQVGYECSRGLNVLLLNPDTIVLGGAIDAMLGAMAQHPEAAVIGPRLLNSDGSFQRASAGAFPSLRNVAWNYLFLHRLLPARLAPAPLFLDRDPGALIEIDWVSGAAMLLRREAVGEQIFDPAFFMFGEDMDLCDRLRRRGSKVLYCGQASIVHHHGRSLAQQSSLEVLATMHRGPRLLFRKRYRPAAAIAYDLVLLVGFLIRWPMFALLARLEPGRGFDGLSRFARRYVGVMLRLPWARP
jgi:GT2 family glycosyltransferase